MRTGWRYDELSRRAQEDPMTWLRKALSSRDTRWALTWLAVSAVLALWDAVFLNAPAFKRVAIGFANTIVIALLVVVFTLALSWMVTNVIHAAERHRTRYLFITFALNVIRSIPQIVGVLFAYVGVSRLSDKGGLPQPALFPVLALCMSVFIFLEVVDLMRERIEHYRRLDFFNALRVCGVPDHRIINFDILWKNSRIHVFNKLISVFGMAVFLQCSVDFIISVGLSTDVSPVSLPPTLGSLLAHIDSKQDILMIGHTLTHPWYLPHLFARHLQGTTVAFLIVFTLLAVYNIANGFAERHRL